MDFKFENLPSKAAHRLLGCFTYQEIAEFRLISRWFNSICSQVLNEGFLNLQEELDQKILEIRGIIGSCDSIANGQLKYKILQMLKIELMSLYVVCERYVNDGLYTFAGGSIIDTFHKIMVKDFDLNKVRNPFESQLATILFLMCEEFSDHFEKKIEPGILNNTFCPWYGSKIMDYLDLYLNSNYHVTAKFNRNCCQILGKYEILNPDCFSELKLNQFDSTRENLRLISRYVRNQMRWHNFFFFVDASFDTIDMNKRKDKKYNKLCLNSSREDCEENQTESNENFVYTRTFTRRLGNPRSKENVFFAFELRCTKDFLPRRLKSNSTTFLMNDSIGNPIENSNNVDSTGIYSFLLTFKLVLPSDEKDCANENYLELYHTMQNCEVSQKSTEIPL